jgi:hypothetical protein
MKYFVVLDISVVILTAMLGKSVAGFLTARERDNSALIQQFQLINACLMSLVFIVLHSLTDEAKVAAAQLNYQQKHNYQCEYLLLA